MTTILESLETAYKHMDLSEIDEPAMNMARLYATKLDSNTLDYRGMKDIGAEMKNILIELLMTPKVRAAIMKGETVPMDEKQRQETLTSQRRAARRRYSSENTAEV